MLMLFLHKNIRVAFSFIYRNKLLAMNDEEQHSPFTHKGPQITPLSSLPLRGAVIHCHCAESNNLEIASSAWGGLATTEGG